MSQNEIDVYAVAIRDAVIEIGERLSGSDRGTLDRYLPLISQTFYQTGEARFPKPLNQHVLSEERFSYARTPSKTQLVCDHVGNAIVALYRCYKLVTVGCTLAERVDLLQGIAKRGLARYDIVGSAEMGFALREREDVKVPNNNTLGLE